MTEVYTWLTRQLTAIAKTIDSKFGWFFKNGNKMKEKERNIDFGLYHYRLTENDNDTVTIEMPKRLFVTFIKVAKFGHDCMKFQSLPNKIPHPTAGTSSAIKGLSYDAFRMAKEAYEDRRRNKSIDNE